MTFKEIIDSAKGLSINELQALISNILQEVDYGSIISANQTFHGLYRARKHNEIDGENAKYLFTNEKEFWNPPVENASLGRCNDKNESMFYSSNQFETSILEVRPEKGKFITVAHFKPIKQGRLIPSFRIKPNCIQHLKEINGYGHLISDTYLDTRDEKFIEVDNLLDNLFTEVVNDEYKYKITNAITRCMLTSITNENGDIFSMNGMVYPSIANNKNSINILLKPIYAINNFHIELLQTFKILETTKEKTIIKLVRNGYVKTPKTHPSDQLDIQWLPEVDGEITEISTS
jgi:hypothetical protein